MININQKLIEKYNREGGLIVVSSYPERGKTYGNRVGGIASFAKNTVTHFKNRPIVVICEVLDREEIYEEGNTLVLRVFKRNTVSMWLIILALILRFTRIPNVLVEYDFALYGDFKVSALVLPFLALLRITGNQPAIVLHAAVRNISLLSGHIGLLNTSFTGIKTAVYNLIFKIFYLLTGLLSSRVIVMEETLASCLADLIPAWKLAVIPHGVDTSLSPMAKTLAKKKLGIPATDQLVLYFGFVNWYKGADIFADTFQKTTRILGKRTHFILAGGESATLNHKPYYRDFFARVFHAVDSGKNIRITGFVKQKDISVYFSAADLIVMPYRAFVSASGPLSLVFSYGKPFIVSEQLKGMFTTADSVSALLDADLKFNDISFPLSTNGLKTATRRVLRNGLKQKMVRYSQRLALTRDWTKIAEIYESVLFAPARSPITLRLERLAARFAYAK
jgi:glycosyltransferase involved in cell wall biosynthesis